MMYLDFISIQVKRRRMPRVWTNMELEEEKLSASIIFYQTFKSNAIQGKGLKKNPIWAFFPFLTTK